MAGVRGAHAAQELWSSGLGSWQGLALMVSGPAVPSTVALEAQAGSLSLAMLWKPHWSECGVWSGSPAGSVVLGPHQAQVLMVLQWLGRAQLPEMPTLWPV